MSKDRKDATVAIYYLHCETLRLDAIVGRIEHRIELESVDYNKLVREGKFLREHIRSFALKFMTKKEFKSFDPLAKIRP